MAKDGRQLRNLFSDYSAFYNDASIIPQQSDEQETLFFAALVATQKSKVIDIGCAEGKLAIELSKRHHQVTAADISEAFLQETRRNAEKSGVSVRTVLFDAEQEIGPLSGELFDTIFLMDVVEHFRNPVAALSNIRELLSDDGQLIIHTPNCVSLGRIQHYFLNQKKARLNYFDPSVLDDLHFQLYDQRSLEKTLNFVGLSVIKMVPTKFTSLGVGKIAKILVSLPRAIATIFPFLADTLLFVCEKCDPINIAQQIKYWQEHNIKP